MNTMQKYRILGKKGEGTFSEVLKCQSIENGHYYACKRMKQHFDSLEQVNNLREIQCMRRLSPHANVVDLKEVIFDKKTGTLALIIELLDMNLYEVIKGRRNYLTETKCKQYTYQTLKALDHMHRNGIFHRDIKPENILLKNDVVKLADFGSCRSVYSKQPYTEYISTRWYRAPECLLTDGWYTYKMDLWSVGCVFAEIMSLRPLFPGSNELDQITRIHSVLGTPTPELLNKFKKSKHMDFNFPEKKGSGLSSQLPHISRDALKMVAMMCIYDPEDRPSAKQILRQLYFRPLRDADKRIRAMEKVTHLSNDIFSNYDDSSITTLRSKEHGFPKKVSMHHHLIAAPVTKNTYPDHTYRTTLPKIPVATYSGNINNNKTVGKYPTTMFPSLMQKERERVKAQNDTTKRLGYAEYSFPSLNRFRHGHRL
ncbi:MAPK/MAK/MRK overlapping kinase-like [Hydractinia symbiolongicarpus]|uniref:MAPK/MAK/MRK overlapping kinase-like n=1 Tax=Hydractinia symbiolongicarpus TaxID=13093 RepID=UPI00254BB2EE|nr:MAPK/MAK/MRK overlapping kinase-like [Hydractinia symbiolongicarpus]